MYIDITLDLKKYNQEKIDLRISDHNTIHELIQITWKLAGISQPPGDGDWIRVVNKQRVLSGPGTLEGYGITSGDRIELL
ncbi:ubiquitin [Halobacillus fulvus]|nr:ubiquitin [Halobacillus fulvus]